MLPQHSRTSSDSCNVCSTATTEVAHSVLCTITAAAGVQNNACECRTCRWLYLLGFQQTNANSYYYCYCYYSSARVVLLLLQVVVLLQGMRSSINGCYASSLVVVL
eukprot:Lankesteria_metandrocarpae@DN2760_c0_g1_i1.p1